MRAVLVVACVAGCASGQAFGTAGDGSQNDQADAKQVADGPIEPADARADARPIDAAIDAPPDAHPDARPIDAAIDAPPDACVPKQTEMLQNPALDLDPPGLDWNQVLIQNVQCSGVPCGPFPVITGDDGVVEHSAPYKIWMGGITGSDVSPAQSSVTDQAFQDFTVPPGTTQLVLTGFFQVASGEDPASTFPFDVADVALIQTNGTPIEDVLQLSNLSFNTTWVQFSHTFTTNLSGQTVRLRFTTTNDITLPTSFYFDTLAVTATHCP